LRRVDGGDGSEASVASASALHHVRMRGRSPRASGVAKGATLKQVYDEAMGAMRPKYGHWVIFEHCMPFNVSRAYDEAKGLDHPRIWTAERDVEMWRALEKGG